MMPLRRAGISVPLFSLRSTRSWGIGEIGDRNAFSEIGAGGLLGFLAHGVLPFCGGDGMHPSPA